MTHSASTGPTICHVLHTMHVGGAEILAAAYARHSTPEFRVVFACLDDLGQLGSRLREEGFRVEVLGRRPGFDWRCAQRLSRFIRREQVNLIHAHQYGPFAYSAFSRIFGGGPPILFMEHGRDYPDYPRPKRKLANRVLLRPRDRVVAVGECVRTALVDNEGIRSARIQVVYNGVDLSRYDSQRREREAVRRELAVAPHQPLIMQVARLNRLKDHVTALKAFAIVSARQPEARLALAGDGEERTALEQRIEELGLQSKVLLLGARHDVPRLVQGADMFLLSSITEGIALTLIEAMATGLPVVATSVGGNGEVVSPGETGLLAPPRAPDELADKLLKRIESPSLREQYGRAGVARAHARFSDVAMHATYHALYREMLGQSATVPSTATYNSLEAASR